MAHPMVESLKRVGLRHGEKAVVGLVSLLTVVLIVMAGSRKSLDTTPEQINQAAKSAQQTLQKPQTKEDIVAILDNAGLVPQDFAKRALEALKAPDDPYSFSGPAWVYVEPGAGLIRDMPKLIAPEELYVNANRGSIELMVRNDQGEIVFEEPKKAGEEKKSGIKLPKSVRRRRQGMGGMMGAGGSGMGDMAGGMMGMMGMGGTPKEPTEAEKKKQAEAAKRKAALFAGTVSDEADEDQKKIDEAAMAGKDPKRETRGARLVAIVGAIDHKQLKENYTKALRDSSAAPHYLRLALQRQELRDGQWTEWADVDRKANEYIQDNILETEEELAPEDVRLEGLVDMLPFFKVGYYAGVHVAEFVPKEKREAPKPAAGMYGMGGDDMAMMGMAMMGMGSEGSMDSAMMGGRGMMGMSMMGMGMGSDMGMSGMAGGFGMGPMGPEDTNFAKSSKDRIMVRSLDFTVDPDSVYRYRVAIVVRNPNLGWENVSPGTDTTTEEIIGPYSEPTDPVRVPSDVAAYASRPSPNPKRSDTIQFQMVRFNPKDGLTIVKSLDYAPGQIVGGPESAAVPKDDNKGRTTRSIDFTSHQVLLDTEAEVRELSPFGFESKFEAPALALMLRPDGTLIVRDQALDAENELVKQMDAIYKQTLEDADKGGKKKSEMQGMDMMGMPGS